MKRARAFAPGHITGLFQICDEAEDDLHKGSKGAGFALKHGVITQITLEENSKPSLEIKLNGKHQESARVSKVVAVDYLHKARQPLAMKIEHFTDIPVGAGFGSSGAGALSLSYAFCKALELPITQTQAAQIAHVAEIQCGTGLGTVLAEWAGGFEIRTKPGAPGVGSVQQLPLEKDYTAVCMILGTIDTQSILSSRETRDKINNSASYLLRNLIETPSLHSFLELSQEFARKIGLCSKTVLEILDKASECGIICSMPMFGNAVFSLVEEYQLDPLLGIFSKYGGDERVLISKIDCEGARLL
jgi:pantoate kinase